MRILTYLIACLGLFLGGCEGDYQGQPGQSAVEIKQQPDLDPRTDHDIDVKTPDVDVDIKTRPGGIPDVKVDAFKTPDKDTDANQP